MRRASTGRRSTWTLRALILALLLSLSLAGDDAAARVGGGQSYRSGGSSGSSYRSGGSSGSSSRSYSSSGSSRAYGVGVSSGGGTADPAVLLLFAAIFVVVMVGKAVLAAEGGKVGRSGSWEPEGPPQRLPPAPTGFRAALVRASDANFSVPAFLDFVTLLYQRVQRERVGPNLDALAPWVGELRRAELRRASQGVRSVHDVVAGAVTLESGAISNGWITLTVAVEASYTEEGVNGTQELAVLQRLVLRKKVGVLSPAPEVLVAMSCPTCGSPGETKMDGRCASCDTPLGGGRALWELVSLETRSSAPVSAPELGPLGVEEGLDRPEVVSMTLQSDMRALQGRDPSFQVKVFGARARAIFMKLQEAWDAGRWSDTRPYQTDCQYQANRYWLARYRRFGLRNRLDKVAITRLNIVAVERDAWYEAITVRVYAQMLDWTEDSRGVVVSGSKDTVRRFSEYWTFLRTLERPAARKGDGLEACPSCGAPLNLVEETGACSHCEARLTGGRFDWVLSRIAQDEVYRG